MERSCNDGNVIRQAEILEKLYKLERSSSQFKNAENANIDFLAQNCYGKFTATEHSSTLTASLDVANAQSACHDCFQSHTEGKNEQESIASETFQSLDERTILFEL